MKSFSNNLILENQLLSGRLAKETPSKTIGDIISKIDDYLDKLNPNAVLIYGDTNSCLSVIPAKKRKRFQFSIWKLEIDVLIKEFLRK